MDEARRLTTPAVRDAWYAIDVSEALVAPSSWTVGRARRAPASYRLFGVPLVAWRTPDGVVRVLTDRCPHRNVPLSKGRIEGDTVRCFYHGWVFDGGGVCQAIPGLEGDPDRLPRRAQAWTVVEQQGMIWVWGIPGEDPGPARRPPRFHEADDPAYLTVRTRLQAPGTLHQVLENALDVPHTAFLHGGLFRNDDARRPVTCTITRWADRAECRFEGERPPTGLAARLLGVGDGALYHADRFLMPSITEVEYRLGEGSHLLLRGACTPVDDDHTDVIACVSIRSPLPRAMVRTVVEPIARRIFAQDAVVLTAQKACIDETGRPRFASTEIDVLGGPILRLLRDAAEGREPDPSDLPSTRTVTMWL